MALPPEDPPAGVPEWVVTYGDMMSLLLTFFIMLVSMSTLKQEGKLRAAMDGIREAFGADTGIYGTPGTSLQTNSGLNELNSKSESSDGSDAKASRTSAGLGGPHKTAARINHGAVITLGGATVFERFDARLTPEIRTNLEIIARIVANRPHLIVVRGHATAEPIPPESRQTFDGFTVQDPADLSFARARAVADYLVNAGIDRKRITVSAAGDSEPRKITQERDLQRQNDRVDVFLIDSYLSEPSAVEPDTSAAARRDRVIRPGLR